ncbi:MAG: hypothetical protein ACK5TA_03095, partial [bacterium]
DRLICGFESSQRSREGEQTGSGGQSAGPWEREGRWIEFGNGPGGALSLEMEEPTFPVFGLEAALRDNAVPEMEGIVGAGGSFLEIRSPQNGGDKSAGKCPASSHRVPEAWNGIALQHVEE